MIPHNLQSSNAFCKHLSKGRERVRSASVSWQYRGPGIHPESCLQSPGRLGRSTRPESPGSTGNQLSCRAERREGGDKLLQQWSWGIWGLAAHCWHCPERPRLGNLKIWIQHINERGCLTTKVNWRLWICKGLKPGGIISLVTFWR